MSDFLAQVVVDEIEKAHAFVTATLSRISISERPEVATQLALAKVALAKAKAAAEEPPEPPQEEVLFGEEM